MNDPRTHIFPHSKQDVTAARELPETDQTRSPSYKLAFMDDALLLREELRPVRFQLELLKTEMAMDEAGINSTVVLFGGARIPNPEHPEAASNPALVKLIPYYQEARKLARMVTEESQRHHDGCERVIVTGGGPGVMEAGNRGAADAGGRSIGLNIVLPHEQVPNAYVTPELCFNFHYFAIRKMHFLMRAKAICVFPGGFGTLDELFEALTLIQTGRMAQVPVLLFGREFWRNVLNLEALVEAGTVSADDLKLFRYVETAEEAISAMNDWPDAGVRRGTIPGR